MHPEYEATEERIMSMLDGACKCWGNPMWHAKCDCIRNGDDFHRASCPWSAVMIIGAEFLKANERIAGLLDRIEILEASDRTRVIG